MGTGTSSGPQPADTASVREHLDRMLRSDPLRRSGNLSHLLQYLVNKALHGEGAQLKESVIAAEVFHRTEEFDSRLDNTVRVHAHRLRKMLDAWYAGDGAHDSLRFVIPRGAYTLQIEPNEAGVREAVPAGIAAEPYPELVPGPPRQSTFPLLALFAGALLGGAGLYAALLLTGHIAASAAPRADSLLAAPLAALWQSAFRPGIATVVSYTNPAYFRTGGNPRIYVTYSGPITAPAGTKLDAMPENSPFVKGLAALGPFFFSDSWTGIGEIAAVHKLTEMAADSGYHVRLIRSRALSYNDIRNSNVIFIGSPWANEMQAKFNIGVTPFQCFGTEKILNNAPRPGEPSAYFPEVDAATGELTVTWALFSVLPGPGAGTRIVSSSGIDTYATMAALDLMTSPAGVLDLMRRFGTANPKTANPNTANHGTLPEYFQAVLRTEIIRGEPVHTSVVSVRAIAQAAQPPGNR